MPMPIDGTDDNDFIVGSADDDIIQAYAGEDLVNGSLGDDEIFGGLGHDGLEGDAGDDILHGGDGNDTLVGGWFGDTDYETLFGDAGDDLLYFAHFSDSEAHGGDGFDTASLSWSGASPDARVEVSLSGAFYIVAGQPSLNAAISFDSIERLVVRSGIGDDVVTGGDANDNISVMGGANTVDAGGGDDGVAVLAGGANTIEGGAGADLLGVQASPAALRFTVDGASASDNFGSTYLGFERYDITGYFGNDRVRLGAGDDMFFGQEGSDRGFGGAGNDRLSGGQGDDLLIGGVDADTLQGGAGDDVLRGGAGRDVLSGGFGQDALAGGGGGDRFLFGAFEAHADTIADMQAGVDKVHIRTGMIGAALAPGAVDASRFATGAAVGADAQFVLVTEGAATALYWDGDGAGAGAAMLVCTLLNGATLTAGDILITS